jgi:hypothetical protein
MPFLVTGMAFKWTLAIFLQRHFHHFYTRLELSLLCPIKETELDIRVWNQKYSTLGKPMSMRRRTASLLFSFSDFSLA